MIKTKLLALGSIVIPIIPFPGGGGGGSDIPIIIVDSGVTFNTFLMDYLSNSGTICNGKIGFMVQYSVGDVNYDIYLVNEYYPNGYLIASGIVNASAPNASFTYDNSRNGTNNKIRIEYYTLNNNSTVNEYNIPLVTSNNSVLSGSSFSYNSGSGKIKYTKRWFNIAETFTFKNFECKYIPSFYHNFSLDDYTIECASDDFVFSAKNIDLYLTNRNGVFDSMPNNGSYLKIPLEVVGTSSPYKLKLKNSYYVNPNTLLMSESYKEGYVETNYIYFPHNEMKYQGEYSGRIVFNSITNTKSNLTFSFTLNAQLNLLGDCIDSEYCVVTKDAYENPYAYEIYD